MKYSYPPYLVVLLLRNLMSFALTFEPKFVLDISKKVKATCIVISVSYEETQASEFSSLIEAISSTAQQFLNIHGKNTTEVKLFSRCLKYVDTVRKIY